MHFTREQVAVLRRLLEISTDRLDERDASDLENLAEVLDAQLDLEEDFLQIVPSESDLEDMQQRFLAEGGF